MTSRKIVILGLMGSGKTTVGRALATQLGWGFSDSDESIEAATGRTVRQLRDERGVDAMHALEQQQLTDALAEQGDTVISAAASVIDHDETFTALLGRDVQPVLLRARPETLAARFASHDQHRPAYGEDVQTFLAQQAARRYPRFSLVHPITVDIDDLDPEQVVEMVTAGLARRWSIMTRVRW